MTLMLMRTTETSEITRADAAASGWTTLAAEVVWLVATLLDYLKKERKYKTIRSLKVIMDTTAVQNQRVTSLRESCKLGPSRSEYWKAGIRVLPEAKERFIIRPRPGCTG